MLKIAEGALVFFAINWLFGIASIYLWPKFGFETVALFYTIVSVFFGSLFAGWWIAHRFKGEIRIESILAVVIGTVLSNLYAYLDSYFATHYNFRIALASPSFGWSMLLIMVPLAYIGAIIGARSYHSKR